eukprot:4113284-Prymnesium_polylepis.1
MFASCSVPLRSSMRQSISAGRLLLCIAASSCSSHLLLRCVSCVEHSVCAPAPRAAAPAGCCPTSSGTPSASSKTWSASPSASKPAANSRALTVAATS